MQALAVSLLVADLLTSSPRLSCWRDGTAAGTLLAQQYCAVVTSAYRAGALDTSGVTNVSVCRGQGLNCKAAMADALSQDRTCGLLYHTDYANDALHAAGYSAQSLYNVFAQECGENAD